LPASSLLKVSAFTRFGKPIPALGSADRRGFAICGQRRFSSRVIPRPLGTDAGNRQARRDIRAYVRVPQLLELGGQCAASASRSPASTSLCPARFAGLNAEREFRTANSSGHGCDVVSTKAVALLSLLYVGSDVFCGREMPVRYPSPLASAQRDRCHRRQGGRQRAPVPGEATAHHFGACHVRHAKAMGRVPLAALCCEAPALVERRAASTRETG
jgi:hypothetical protein